jgi:transcriptional regulator with XRE-family HTH domain
MGLAELSRLGTTARRMLTPVRLLREVPGVTFAERLRQLREAAGFSQVELAQRAMMHPQAVVKLERGENNPRWETVQALAKALGVNCLAFSDEEAAGEAAPPADLPPPTPRRPGRPRKKPVEEPAEPEPPKRPRGRPRKPKGSGS